MADATSAPSSKARIAFYDIGQRPPVEESASAPNPWKTRLALNFKNADFKTTWVPYPDIAKVRKSLGAPAGRQFADGSDFYTLPVIQDTATGETVGDSFDIAVWLQNKFPDSGSGDLFPPQDLDYKFVPPFAFPAPLSERPDGGFPQYLRFNTEIDNVFSSHTPLMAKQLPFDPATAEASKAEFVRRSGLKSWDDFTLEGEARQKILDSFKSALGDLAKLFTKTEGIFLLGDEANYADLIVGGWLRMCKVTLRKEEWEDLKIWHNGVFGKLHDALDQYADMK